jgi:hypothetical protein
MAISLWELSDPLGDAFTQYTDGAPATRLFPGAFVTTTGGSIGRIDRVTISLGAAAQSGETLVLSSPSSFPLIESHFDAATGVLTLTGANVADLTWQNALRNVTYANTNDAPGFNRTIAVVATNTDGPNSATATDYLSIFSGHATLAAIGEDTASPAGATVSSLFLDNFYSSWTSFAGIAIGSYTVDAAKGNWQYSTNGGTSWVTLGSATTAAAIRINAADKLRFVPAANYNGSATALSANLLDNLFVTFTSGTTVSVANTGGSTGIQANPVALSETITAVNDAPVNSVPGTQTDSWTNANVDGAGNLVFGAVNGNALSVSDVDSSGLSVNLVATNGTLAFSTTSLSSSGVTQTDVDGADGSVTISGTASQIAAALEGFTYHTTSTDTASGNIDATVTMTTSDGSGGLDADVININVVCFMPGTRIVVPGGETNVEKLKAGDVVVTTTGESKPVRWVGRQTVSRIFADPLRVLPIRVRAGALGEDLPIRDLLVSSDHALLVDGLLVQAGALVNGTSIVRGSDVPQVYTYYHVELDDHSLILAEGVAAETFVDNLDRLGFDNWAEHEALYPDGKFIEEMAYPRAKAYRQVSKSIRSRLAQRGAELFGENLRQA